MDIHITRSQFDYEVTEIPSRLTNTQLVSILEQIPKLKSSQVSQLLPMMIPSENVTMPVLMKAVWVLKSHRFSDGSRRKLARWVYSVMVCFVSYDDATGGRDAYKLIPLLINMLKLNIMRSEVVSMIVFLQNRLGLGVDYAKVWSKYKCEMIWDILKVDPRVGPLVHNVWLHMESKMGPLDYTMVRRKQCKPVDERMMQLQAHEEQFKRNFDVYQEILAGEGNLVQYVNSLENKQLNLVNILRECPDDVLELDLTRLLDLSVLIDQQEFEHVLRVLLVSHKGGIVVKPNHKDVLSKVGMMCALGHTLPAILVEALSTEDSKQYFSLQDWIEYLPLDVAVDRAEKLCQNPGGNATGLKKSLERLKTRREAV